MSLILRRDKGTALTMDELDDNQEYLEGLATSAGEQNLESVLTAGNTTGENDIVISSGQKINAASGGGQLNLRNGGDDRVILSTDAGASTKQGLNLEEGFVRLYDKSLGGLVDLYAIEGAVDLVGKGARIIVGDELNQRIEFATTLTVLNLTIRELPIYADNAAAVSGGLGVDRVYKTATGELRIVV